MEKLYSAGGRRERLACWIAAGLVLALYAATLKPGHAFVSDDFASYVMHAENLANGQPYAATRYIPNPAAMWIAPPNGYPPVYPFLIAPIYKIWGLNLVPMKGVTVFCFAVFVLLFGYLFRQIVPMHVVVLVIALISVNPLFWEYRNYLLSEFPYLMFSFGALLMTAAVYDDLVVNEWRWEWALLLATLLWCAYGTRTIGIALVPALILADVAKFRRPSRFAMLTVAMTAALIVAQAALITAPKGYIAAVHLSAKTTYVNGMYYAKTLSYVWFNGFSKTGQIIFALIFTALAVTAFMSALWAKRTMGEFYVLVYLGILVSWSAEIGLRGLLPILPFYFAYGMGEFFRQMERLKSSWRTAAFVVVCVVIAASYIGNYRYASRQAEAPNVEDAMAKELFAFLRENGAQADIVAFHKARTVSLFTGRRAATLDAGETVEEATRFLDSIDANILVQADWSPPIWKTYVDSNRGRLTEIFHNAEYQVYRIAKPKRLAGQN